MHTFFHRKTPCWMYCQYYNEFYAPIFQEMWSSYSSLVPEWFVLSWQLLWFHNHRSWQDSTNRSGTRLKLLWVWVWASALPCAAASMSQHVWPQRVSNPAGHHGRTAGIYTILGLTRNVVTVSSLKTAQELSKKENGLEVWGGDGELS